MAHCYRCHASDEARAGAEKWDEHMYMQGAYGGGQPLAATSLARMCPSW